MNFAEFRRRNDGAVPGAPTEFDLVVFDCDGVLVDSEVLSCGCLAELLCEQGYVVDLQGVFDQFLGRSFSVVEQQYELALGRPLPADFVGRFGAELKERFARDLRPIAGVEAVLAEMRGRFCVASSSDFDRLSFSLAVTRLARYFGNRVYSSDAVAHGKPEPDLFLHAADRMGCEPARSLVIEDSVHGVLAGKAAGMTVWGFVGGGHHAGRDGSAVLAVAGADRILRDMAELGPI